MESKRDLGFWVLLLVCIGFTSVQIVWLREPLLGILRFVGAMLATFVCLYLVIIAAGEKLRLRFKDSRFINDPLRFLLIAYAFGQSVLIFQKLTD